ncbi:MAG: 2-dehydropantoate 2-reductase [Oscillospiraceae bacterium]|nr:2-dehydropantoate 2-reductase [Oscillospiraceae bacterium]
MKIAMIGSGAAGSVFAAYLKKGGADMYLVDMYKAHMDKIAAEGLRFRLNGEEELLKGFTCAYNASQIGVMDMVIIMVKATQTESIMPSVLPCIGEHTVLISLQNGLDNDYVLKQYVPAERILCGFGQIGTELPEPGLCVSKPESGIVMRFGPASESAASRAAGLWLEDCFVKGGCCASYEENIWPYIWRKAISNSGYNTVSALLGLKVGAILANEQGRELVLSVWQEACRVAEAAGAGDLWPEMQQELPRLAAGFADYYPSMAQDVLLNHRQTEILHLNGAIARYGDELGVPTPVNRALTRAISCIQANYDLRKA